MIKDLKDILGTGVRYDKFELDDEKLNLLTHEISIDTDGGIYICAYLPEEKIVYPKNLTVTLGKNKFVCTDLEDSHTEFRGDIENKNIAKIDIYLSYKDISFNENIH